ncbi:MAG: winged helix-turn-helix domain-containing protein [Acidobacteria bacterium]|nr:winged helix-turn-helix domain-containing protein [Acidobacteriota bacterium]
MPQYRFGLFQFDSDQALLSRDGVPIKLQRQPAQALHLLLSHNGAIVSRETLRDALWGSETFVDFDSGLNFCIAQVRSALRDSAESPRYIKTVPRKGYQFIAPIITAAPAPLPPPISKPRYLYLLLPLLILLAGTAFWRFQTRPSPPAVAVFRLDNNTGDPQYDKLAEVLTDSLIADLTEAGFKNGAPAYAVIGNDARLIQPRSQRDLAAIGANLKTPFTISGSLRPAPGGVEVFAQLITLPDQRHRKVVLVNLSPTALSEVPRRIVQAFDPVIRAVQAPL